MLLEVVQRGKKKLAASNLELHFVVATKTLTAVGFRLWMILKEQGIHSEPPMEN